MLFEDIPIVITASKTEQPITEAPAAMEIITEKEIRELGFRTLADALRTVPGYDVSSEIFMVFASPRGFNHKRINASVLYLIDGHPYNEVMRGSMDPLWISLAHVKRIEIIKGPGSALYGANAMAGVINIITKTAEDAGGTKVTLAGGTLGTLSQEFTGGYRSDTVDTFFSAWHYKTDAISGHAVNNNDDRDDLNFFGKVTSGRLTVSANHYRAVLGMPGTVQEPTPTFRGDFTHNYAAADYRIPSGDDLDITFRSHVLLTRHEVDETAGRLEADSTQTGIEAQANYWASPSLLLVAGGEWKLDYNRSEHMQGEKQIQTLSSYVQGEWRPTGKLILTAGGRYDVPSAYESVFSPRVNLTYKYSGSTIFKTSYGEAFRAPNFFELYMDGIFIPASGIKYRLLGQPDLLPEKMKTVSAGVSHRFSRELHMNLDLFYTTTFNTISFFNPYIVLDPVNGLMMYMKNTNKSRATMTGGELAFDYKIAPRVETLVSYAYQHDRDLDSDRRLDIAPEHKITMVWYLKVTDRLRINTFSYYVSDRDDTFTETVNVPAYTVSSVNAIMSVRSDLDLSLEVFNLFGEKYADFSTFPLFDRTVLARASYKF